MGNWNASYLVIAEGNKKDIDSFEKYFYSGKALLTFIREDVCKPYFGMRSTCHRINDHKIYVAVEDDDSTGPGFWQTHSDIEHLAKTFPGLKLKNIFVVEMNGKDNYMHSEIGFESFLEGKPDKSLTIPIGAIDWECEYFTNILYEELHRKMLFAINFPREKLTPAQKKFLAYLDEINDKRGNISTSNVFKFHSLISRKNFFKLESSYYETILNRLINTSVFDDLFAEAKKEESGLPDSAYRYYSLKWLTKEFIIKKRLDRYFAIAEDFVKQNRNLLIKNYFDYSSTWYLLPHHDDDGKHFGQLSKGTVLQDTSAFKKQKDEPVKSLIKIIRLDDLCNELSNPWVYPVKIEDNTRVEKADECSWYTEKAVLLEPFNIWEVIAKLGGFSEGTIGIHNPLLGLDVTLSFDATLFPWLWIWQLYGGAEEAPFAGAYCLALEPWSGPPTLTRAIAADSVLVLAPNESRSTTLSLTIEPSPQEITP